ncbi:cation:proton antiporter domain-containing protein [Streptomyces violarus]|uniref:cation:proton antiporter domain-containing protein n=1 Tax=Streptomyces violarus TaxID=67380 RepID=UPI0021C10E6B|nr:cation:proton antiporter [Streptomyces violarus]MCT9139788.1 cation:proton antiporter [Streptomyces violarus]
MSATEREEYARLRKAASVHHRRLRYTATSVLLLLTFLLAPLAVVAAWVDSAVADTDRYVQTVAPIATEPSVQKTVTDRLTKRVVDNVDVAAFTEAVARTLQREGAPPPTKAEAPAAVDDTAGLAGHLAGLLASLSFLVFGAVLLGPTLDDLDWRIIVYAVLSLTVVRMLPVALSLARTGLALPTVAYIGWFGPRGLASVVFGLLLVEEHVPGVQLLGRVIAVTVALSILLHGMSAVVLAKRYGAWYRKAADRRPRLREDLPGDGEAGQARTTPVPHRRPEGHS